MYIVIFLGDAFQNLSGKIMMKFNIMARSHD